MPLETATYISQLNQAYPTLNDAIRNGDDHIRLVKTTIKNTFPNVSGAVTVTHDDLNDISGIGTEVDAKAESSSLVGMISPFASGTANAGWLRCDGTHYLKTTYPALWTHLAQEGTEYEVDALTFKVPEIRGEIIRDLDDGRGIDVGRTINSAQAGQNEAHDHDVSATTGNESAQHTHGFSATSDSDGSHTHEVYVEMDVFGIGKDTLRTTEGVSNTTDGSVTTTAAGNHTHTVSGTTVGASVNHTHSFSTTSTSSGGSEARMRNIAFPHFIRHS